MTEQPQAQLTILITEEDTTVCGIATHDRRAKEVLAAIGFRGTPQGTVWTLPSWRTAAEGRRKAAVLTRVMALTGRDVLVRNRTQLPAAPNAA